MITSFYEVLTWCANSVEAAYGASLNSCFAGNPITTIAQKTLKHPVIYRDTVFSAKDNVFLDLLRSPRDVRNEAEFPHCWMFDFVTLPINQQLVRSNQYDSVVSWKYFYGKGLNTSKEFYDNVQKISQFWKNLDDNDSRQDSNIIEFGVFDAKIDSLSLATGSLHYAEGTLNILFRI